MQPFNEGIMPDILVDYTLEEFLNQKVDKDVEAAVEVISKQINR
jgi:C-terminal processing protease CtpA/Prc